MNENQINDLLERLNRLAIELSNSDIKGQWDTKENHIQAIRMAIALITSNKGNLN